MPKVSIAIDVQDRELAESFYIEALACEHLKNPYPHMTVVCADNAEIWLVEKRPGSNPIPDTNVSRAYNRHWTPVHLDFYVDDIKDTLTKVVTLGGSTEQGDPGKWAFCADPFGNGFCLIQTDQGAVSDG